MKDVDGIKILEDIELEGIAGGKVAKKKVAKKTAAKKAVNRPDDPGPELI
jgi:hypothetical protein